MKNVLPYLQRLLEDEYVQEQLRDGAVALRAAYLRAARKRAQAAEDKKLYASLREAATAIRNAVITLAEPEPPPRRWGRKMLIVALAGGAAALLTRLGQDKKAA